MRALVRLAGIGVIGIAMFYIGQVNGAMQSRPQLGGVVLVVAALAMCLVLLAWLVSGTGRGDGAAPGNRQSRTLLRWLWLGVTAYAFLGIASFFTLIGTARADDTPYHNDAIALTQCAVDLLLEGRNPYSSLDIFACYDRLGIGPDRTTPLRLGLLRDVEVYPTDEELWRAWQLRRADPASNVEFEWRPSYPALALLLLVPWVVLGLDPNHLSVILLAAGMALVLLRAERSARGLVLTSLLASIVIIAWTIGGSSDLLYALPLLIAWLWRERRWSALAFGVACATKQLAWFVAPYYFLQVLSAHGWREAVRRAGIVALVFVVANAPFAAADFPAWLAGVTAPIRDPMFARGSGIVFLSTSGIAPLLPAVVYAALEGLAALVLVAIAWRVRKTSPEVGVVFAFLPLFFAWRSLFSYFFLLPLFAAGAVARMPLGVPESERVERAGGVALVDGPRRPVRAGT